VNPDGTMDVPAEPGFGVDVNMKMPDKVTVRKEIFSYPDMYSNFCLILNNLSRS
jgi:hypothetical protein